MHLLLIADVSPNYARFSRDGGHDAAVTIRVTKPDRRRRLAALLDEHRPLALDSGDADVDFADFDPDCGKQIVQNRVKGWCHGAQGVHQCLLDEIR